MSRHGKKKERKGKRKINILWSWARGLDESLALPNVLGSMGSRTACRHTHTHTHTRWASPTHCPCSSALCTLQRVHTHSREHKSCIQPVNCTKCYCGAFPALSLSHSVTKCKLMPRHMTRKHQILHLAKSLWLARMSPPSLFCSFLFEPH